MISRRRQNDGGPVFGGDGAGKVQDTTSPGSGIRLVLRFGLFSTTECEHGDVAHVLIRPFVGKIELGIRRAAEVVEDQ